MQNVKGIDYVNIMVVCGLMTYQVLKIDRKFVFAFDCGQCEQSLTIVSMLSLPGAETVSKRQTPGQTSAKVIVMVNALDKMCKKITIRL